MKRLMDEVVAWYVEAMHYSASTAIRVEVGKATSVNKNRWYLRPSPKGS